MGIPSRSGPQDSQTFTGERLCVRAKPLQSCPSFCKPLNCGPPGSSVLGILQARILEHANQPNWLHSSSLPALPAAAGCPEHLCSVAPDSGDPIPPRSSVHGIFKARIVEWIAISSSRESSQPRDRIHISYISCTGRNFFFLPLHHLGNPLFI